MMRIRAIVPEYEFDDEDSLDVSISMKLVCLFSGSLRFCGSLRPFSRVLFVVVGVVAEDNTSSSSSSNYYLRISVSQGGEIGSSHVPVSSTHCTDTASIGEDTPSERRERKKWTFTEEVVLISAWLNTSKDPFVGNEQRAGAFWKCIAAYFAASPKVQCDEKRESIQRKQRWQKINDLVSKFSGSYEAATRQKTSGMNEHDVVKLAHDIFLNDHKIKFNLQHAWEELRYDQKWCEVATSKIDGSCKKRKCDDGAQSSSSYATTNDGEQRPPGVKASKRGSAKKTNEDVSGLQSLWAIKEKYLEVKEKLSKMGLLHTLIAKSEPLSEFEEALKKNLIAEMLGSVSGGSV